MEDFNIEMFWLLSRDGLPYKRSLESSSWCKSRILLAIKDTLFSIILRLGVNRGQRRRKWSEVSDSNAHLQMGLGQLKFFGKRWARRSLCSTHRRVRRETPALSWIAKIFFLSGLMDAMYLLLKIDRELLFLIRGSMEGHTL